MSQSGALTTSGSGAPPVETLTGNSGGAVGPDGSFNIDIVGNNTSGINVVGTPLTNTLTIVGIQATTSQRGTVTLATNAQAIAGTDTVNALTSDDLKAKLGTQTAHSLAVFEGTSSAITALGVATDGQLPIGSIGADPVLATLTAGVGIAITNGPGSISIATNGSTVINTLSGNTGGPISPTAGNINTLGSGSITISGLASTLTTHLTGLTNHAVLVGAGTDTITNVGPTAVAGQVLQSAGAAADPAFSTATYPLTTTIDQILYSSAANTVTGLATANDGILVTSNTGVPSILAGPGTTGQVLQANAAAAPSFSTASYPSTTTINQILYSSANNVVDQLATANRAVLTTGTTGVPVLTALAADGQLIIGSTAGVPAAATLTPGAGIAITNGSNSITIAATGAGFAWSDQSGAFAAVKENGYFITATATATLPATPTDGDTIAFIVDTTQILTITGNTGQKIRVGSAISGAAGTCASNARGDSIELVYRSTGTTWFSLSAPQGTWTVT